MSRKVNWKKPALAARKALADAGIVTPPVSPHRVAQQLGIQVRYKAVDRDISGFISRRGDAAVVGINTHHHLNRQRFTLAHEIGHFCLHGSKELYIDHVPKFRDVKSSKAVDPEEIEANLFAAELLMPEEFLMKDMAAMEDDRMTSEAVANLAKRYGVSPEAMRTRLERIRGVQFEV